MIEKMLEALEKGDDRLILILALLGAIGFLVKLIADQKKEIVAERKINEDKDKKVLEVIKEYHDGTTDVVRAMNSIEKILAEMKGQMLATFNAPRRRDGE